MNKSESFSPERPPVDEYNIHAWENMKFDAKDEAPAEESKDKRPPVDEYNIHAWENMKFDVKDEKPTEPVEEQSPVVSGVQQEQPLQKDEQVKITPKATEAAEGHNREMDNYQNEIYDYMEDFMGYPPLRDTKNSGEKKDNNPKGEEGETQEEYLERRNKEVADYQNEINDYLEDFNGSTINSQDRNKGEDYLTGLHDIVGATPKKDDEAKQAAPKDENTPSKPEKDPGAKLTDEEKEVLKNNGYEYDEKNKIIRYREKANTAEKQGWFNRIFDWFKNHNFSFFGKGKREKELEEASKANQPAPASDNRNTGKNETTDEGNIQEAGKDVADNTDEQAKDKQSEKSYEKFEKRADILAKNIYAALAASDDDLEPLIEAALQANSRLYWPDRVTQDLLTYSSKENEEIENKNLMNAYNAAEYIINKSPRWEEYQNRRDAIRGEIRSDYH